MGGPAPTTPVPPTDIMATSITHTHQRSRARARAPTPREEEERGNAMKALENRTLDSKREMDIMAALDEMRSLRARHAGVTTEQVRVHARAHTPRPAAAHAPATEPRTNERRRRRARPLRPTIPQPAPDLSWRGRSGRDRA